MIVIPCEQGSPEWFAARVGIPSASQFHRIISGKTGKALSGAETYRNEMLAEWLLGSKLDTGASQFMARGSALEESAVRYYELQREVDTTEVGFILHDTLAAGCSPDRLVGDGGGLEIKCPSPAVHVGYLLGGIDAHRVQVQGAMWITGRTWWDLMSYNPELPPVLVRLERDESFIDKLGAEVAEFCHLLELAKNVLRDKGYVSAERGGNGLPSGSSGEPLGATPESGHSPAPTDDEPSEWELTRRVAAAPPYFPTKLEVEHGL